MREDRFFALFFSFYECWQVDFDYGHITHFCFSKETWLFQFQSGKLESSMLQDNIPPLIYIQWHPINKYIHTFLTTLDNAPYIYSLSLLLSRYDLVGTKNLSEEFIKIRIW